MTLIYPFYRESLSRTSQVDPAHTNGPDFNLRMRPSQVSFIPFRLDILHSRSPPPRTVLISNTHTQRLNQLSLSANRKVRSSLLAYHQHSNHSFAAIITLGFRFNFLRNLASSFLVHS